MRTFIMFGLTLVFCSTALGADWPQWRGPDRTEVSRETGLMKEWPESGPNRLWMTDRAGLGYAGIAVVGDTVYTMGARGEEEFLIALNVSDGTETWATSMGPPLSNRWGDGPRGTPTVVGDRVYAMSGKGDLICADATDGNLIWKASMGDFGGEIPQWGYTESLLIDGDKLICTPGGKKGAIVALNPMTGKLVWQSKDFTEGAQYSSVIVAEHNGERQYIQLTMQKVVGLEAATGDVLWTTDWPGQTAVIPTPIFHDGLVYLTSGYNVGCRLIKLAPQHKVVAVYDNKTMKNQHGGVVLIGDHIYGYSDGLGWVCQDFATGEEVWKEKDKFGKGCLTFADGRLYLIDEKSGEVAIIEASPAGWSEHGRFTLEPQTQKRSPSGRIWTHPTVANGRLYLRDQELLFSYDIADK